jgi:predicted enzyme related to lactoylglutathione lyase
MKKIILLISALTASFYLGFFLRPVITIKAKNNQNDKQSDIVVKPKKVTGIGGIFFKCKEPNKIKEWYKNHLGFDTNEFGTSFEWQEGIDTTKKGSLQWSPFSENTTYFSPSTKDFMINYRVQDLVALVAQLKIENVTIVDTIETYEYGRFIHIMDPEGNKIELYEPNYSYRTHKAQSH